MNRSVLSLLCILILAFSSVSGCGSDSTTAPSPNNQPPNVAAGADQAADFLAGAHLTGQISDDGLSPVVTQWSQVSGPGIVTFDDSLSAETIASFSETGTYVLRLMADDGDFTAQDDLTVQVVHCWKVDAKASAGGDGESWATAFQSPQDALLAASSGGEVWVAGGTYKPTSGTDRSIYFALKSGVSLYGGFAGTESDRFKRNWEVNLTILSGDIGAPGQMSDNSYHVVTGADLARLDGFTVTRGNAYISNWNHADNKGGGMSNVGVSPTVANCIFLENSAYQNGGGMHNQNATPIITDCSFIDNILIPKIGTADGGGGMSNESASPSVTNCLFMGNSAYNGGGMYNQDPASAPIVEGCIFVNNTGFDGGGIYNGQSSPIVTNSLFLGNSADRNGGGIMNNYYSSPIITNCTFSGNSANNGNAVQNWYWSQPQINNCILWDGGSEIGSDTDSSPTVTYSNIQGGYPGTGNLDATPLFAASATPEGDDGVWRTEDDGLRLLSASPCIDAANGNAAPAMDILGEARFDDPDTTDTGVGDPTYADIGAYEFH